MRLAVLDANVIVSAGLKADGSPAKLILDWVLEGQVLVATCPVIVAGYREVVGREKFRGHGFPPLWLEFLIDESLRIQDPAPWPLEMPDPKDAPFLALADLSGAVLVTGNLKHFPESFRRGVQVLSPAEYCGHLTGQGS